ncbi:GDP-mannose 4,6-dehydratase [Acidisoma cladoniae]|uniref:GDP-mannose 4,6-dehydratase n=1 Tax=Acidisoma cladoniae TaxID=3040935 RepID=UPI00254C59B2|nr:GDP-mannose 4,6-dehydratase [Acidisoma sp. PAMC 29798]
MRILVTGLSGFVGGYLPDAVARQLPGATVVALGCDITDQRAVASAVASIKPDLCLHLAAIAAIGVARADPDRTWAVNLHGTLSLARAIMAHVPSCPFLFVSSADAYGLSFRAGVPLDENAPLAPLNTYGATKAAADLALGAMAADGLHAIRLRAFNHTGAGQTPDFAIPAFARQIALIEAGEQDPVVKTGNLTSQRDFLDVRDVVQAYALALSRAPSLAPGTIINIASGTSRRIGDVLDQMIGLSGVSARVETESARARSTDIPIALGDASAAHRLLDWTPRIAWEQTLMDVLADWRIRVRPLAD